MSYFASNKITTISPWSKLRHDKLIFFGVISGMANPIQLDGALNMYNKGNFVEAFEIFQSLAIQGDADAQLGLGTMYAQGHGVVQDYKQAVDWFRKAAEQGHAPAQYNLGIMYVKGQGVPQDHVRAHMWFNLAAAKGHSDAVKNRDVVASKMTQAQIGEAQKLARECEQRNYKNCE